MSLWIVFDDGLALLYCTVVPDKCAAMSVAFDYSASFLAIGAGNEARIHSTGKDWGHIAVSVGVILKYLLCVIICAPFFCPVVFELPHQGCDWRVLG